MSCKPQIDQLCLTSDKVGFVNLHLQRCGKSGYINNGKFTCCVWTGSKAQTHNQIILDTKEDQHFHQKENTLNN